jgi:hypothetical protein
VVLIIVAATCWSSGGILVRPPWITHAPMSVLPFLAVIAGRLVLCAARGALAQPP